jgi:hypothetical protein
MLIASNLLNPSSPPFSKGRIYAPLWQRGAWGDFNKFNYPRYCRWLRRKHEEKTKVDLSTASH